MASIKIRTFVVCRAGTAVASELTREQAERCATVLSWIAQGA